MSFAIDLARRIGEASLAGEGAEFDVRRAISSLEKRLSAIEASLRSTAAPAPAREPGARRPRTRQRRVSRRMPKDEVRSIALEAARSLASRGEKVTIASVAKESGLQYGQITYAFGRKDNLIEELSKAGVSL